MAKYDTPSLPDQKKAEYDGREVTLYDPFRIDDDEKKFAVYVENPDSGNINKVKFGSADMEIKRDSEDNLKSFRARMKCDDLDQSDKHTAKFWSCVFWRGDKSVSDLLGESFPGPSIIPKSKIRMYLIQEYNALVESSETSDVSSVLDRPGMVMITPQSPKYDSVEREVKAENPNMGFSGYSFYVVNTKTYDTDQGFSEVWGGNASNSFQFGTGMRDIQPNHQLQRVI